VHDQVGAWPPLAAGNRAASAVTEHDRHSGTPLLTSSRGRYVPPPIMGRSTSGSSRVGVNPLVGEGSMSPFQPRWRLMGAYGALTPRMGDAPGRRVIAWINSCDQKLRVLSCPSGMTVSHRGLIMLADPYRQRRATLGTRGRRLDADRQAPLTLAYLRNRDAPTWPAGCHLLRPARTRGRGRRAGLAVESG
jgi:hypothetical protein